MKGMAATTGSPRADCVGPHAPSRPLAAARLWLRIKFLEKVLDLFF